MYFNYTKELEAAVGKYFYDAHLFFHKPSPETLRQAQEWEGGREGRNMSTASLRSHPHTNKVQTLFGLTLNE